ncbi:MAG: hypothetical protein ACC661_07640, partial [Verrucomicrobiales bacterium]
MVFAILCALFAGQAAGVEQVTLRGGVFFEAEGFDELHTEAEQFALRTPEKEASDSAVLSHFHQGHVTYRFTLSAAGVQALWVRYAAPGNARMDVAIDPGEAPEFTTVVMAATGGAVGPGVWGWQRVWQGKLAAGEHVLALGSASLRPDCIFITPQANKKPDDAMLAEVKWPGGPRLPELEHQRKITRHPSWLDRHWRVAYAHPEWNREITIEQWCRKAAAEGANLICAAGEIPAGMLEGELVRLPTDARELPPGYKVDYSWVKRYAAAAHDNGLKYLCYVNADRSLDPLLLEHPQWREMGFGDKPRDTWGCWHSPYRAAFIKRLVRIARDSHFDGIMIDMGFTAPPGGCRSRYCAEKFRSLFKVDPPYRLLEEDP